MRQKENDTLSVRSTAPAYVRGATARESAMQDGTGERGRQQLHDVIVMRTVAVSRSCVTAYLHMYTG